MSDSKYDIHKSAGTIIQNGKILVARSKGKSVFVHPGGKLEDGESAEESLVRELKEELDIAVSPDDLEFFGCYYAIAAGGSGKRLKMDVFDVRKYSGEIKKSREIAELKWLGSDNRENLELGSILEHEILPQLKKTGRIN